jgi:hypothetical protein
MDKWRTGDEIDPVYRVFVQDGKLKLAWLKHKPMALDPRTRDAFSGPLGTIRFTRDPKQRISGFTLTNYSVATFASCDAQNKKTRAATAWPSRP